METDTFTPIIIDLGTKSISKIKKLKKGEGELIEEIEFTYNNVKQQLSKDGESKEIVPLIILYKEKEKQSFPFPIPFFKM